MYQNLTHAGRRLLDRRGFLQSGGTGLAGIALASLLADEQLLASEPPIRPKFEKDWFVSWHVFESATMLNVQPYALTAQEAVPFMPRGLPSMLFL